MFTPAVSQHPRIDELAPAIGIQPQYGKREQLAGSIERLNDERLAAVEQRDTFGPDGRHTGECENRQIGALVQRAAMGHHVNFQKAGPRIVPAVKGADGDLFLEQRPRPRHRAGPRQHSLGTQEPIGRRRTDREQLGAHLWSQRQMPVAFQRLDQGR